MKQISLRNTLAVSVLAAVSGFAVQASAAPSFTFTEVAGFDSSKIAANNSIPTGVLYEGAAFGGPGPAPTAGANGVPASSTFNNTMTWQDGVADPRRSHLVLSNPNGEDAPIALPAVLTTPTAWFDLTTLTHINNVIAQSFSWGPQDIWGRLTIEDGGINVLDNVDPTTITFTETQNTLVGGVCQFGNPFNPLAAPCPDFFTFTFASLDPVNFTANDGSFWQVNFRIDPVCNNCVVDPITSSVYTREGTTSSLTVEAQLVCIRNCTQEVPEPSILTLLGLGLVGLGFTGWRRKQRNLA